MNEDDKYCGKCLATKHVDWFLEIIRPLLISWFEHGYKHGYDEYGKQLYGLANAERDALQNELDSRECGRDAAEG